jgi:hypothetical protein
MTKFIAKFVGVAMVLSLVTAGTSVSTVSAATTAELQAQIDALLAQLAGLKPTSTSTGTSSSSSYTFTRDLTLGSTGADVVELQKILVAGGYLQLPTGVSMGYFGAMTKTAVAKWQAAVGIAPAAGYFGPMSRAKIAGSTTTTTTTTTTTNSDLKGGAGDVTVTEKSSGVEDEIVEGDEEVKVLGVEVEADGSDIEVTSVRVEFEHDGAGSDRLDKYVDEVQIMFGDEVVGTADVDDFSESSDVYSRNIAVSDVVIDEDEEEMLYVSITASSNIDSDDLGEDWEVALGQIRFEDATGAILTDSTGTGVNGSITETFSFEDLSTSGDVELKVTEDDEEINDARTVQADDSNDTNDVEILSFAIEAEGSEMFLNDIDFDITSVGAGVTEIANDFTLLMDGEEVGQVTIDTGNSFASSSDTTRTITFTDLDDDDVVIEKDGSVSFVLTADINDVDGGFTNGDSLSAELTASTDIDADDENGDTVTDLTGSASSEAIAFAATGLMIDQSTTASTKTSVLNLDTTSTDNQGVFEIYFDVTAFDDTAFIALTATTTSTTAGAAGAYGYIETVGNNDVAVSTGTTTATLERVSGGTVTGNYVRINDGQKATFKLTVTTDVAATNDFRAQLGQVNFATSATAGTSSQSAVPTSDYQSPSMNILN